MKEILQQQFLNNTIEQYLWVAGVIVTGLLIKRLISKFFAKVLYRFFSKSSTPMQKDTFMQLIIGPLDNFLLVLILIVSLEKLKLPPALLEFTVYKINIRDILDAIAHTAFIVVFIRLCIRLVKFMAILLEQKANLTPDQTDNQLVVFFRDFFKVLLYIIGFLMIMQFTFHYDISKLVTGLSIVGAAVALATKESLENLIASFIIFFDKPFTTGDLVKVQGFTGNVERIGLRSTRIRTDHKTFITVPNKQMVDTILDNITLRTERRAEVKLEVGLSAGTAQIRSLIGDIKNLLDKEPVITGKTVYLSDTGRNAHVITVEYFTSMEQDIQAFIALRETINFAIIELLHRHEVDFAASTMDITLRKEA